MKQYSGIILAGGRSSRMKEDKAELLLNGKSFLDLAVDRYRRAGITDIVISRNNGDTEYQGFPVVPDEERLGPLSGLYAALKAVRFSAAVVLPVDMPLVDESVIQRLTDAHTCGITAACTGEQIQPLAAVYDKAVGEVIARLLSEGKRRVMELQNIVAFRTVDFPEDIFINCNTPEEYRFLLEQHEY